jgi:hypothetical protein
MNMRNGRRRRRRRDERETKMRMIHIHANQHHQQVKIPPAVDRSLPNLPKHLNPSLNHISICSSHVHLANATSQTPRP